MLADFRDVFGRASDALPNLGPNFEMACISLITTAYTRMKNEKKYKLTWKEPRISAHLIGYMRRIRDEADINLGIDPECHLYREEILTGQVDPDTAPRIDFKIRGAWVQEDAYYGVEAKILVEVDWGARQASGLRSRYIDTGIDNFVNGRYSPSTTRGCIAGYVIQGNASKIVQKINGLLVHRGRTKDTMKNRHSFNGCPDCYQSKHIRTTDNEQIEIYHTVLTFC